jgi:hypothetical protein
MKVTEKILNEIFRYRQINNYISEQELPPPPSGELPPPTGELPPPPGGAPEGTPPPAEGVQPPAPEAPVPVDVENDPDVEKVGEEKEQKKEIEVTDLVKGQENVEKKQEEYFNNLFSHLDQLENKLTAMDDIINKLNNIETKLEKYRTKTPEEKLELRTFDSGPFNKKLSDFFQDKEDEFEKTGKDQYIITPDDVESYSSNEIKSSFRDFDVDDADLSGFKNIY